MDMKRCQIWQPDPLCYPSVQCGDSLTPVLSYCGVWWQLTCLDVATVHTSDLVFHILTTSTLPWPGLFWQQKKLFNLKTPLSCHQKCYSFLFTKLIFLSFFEIFFKKKRKNTSVKLNCREERRMPKNLITFLLEFSFNKFSQDFATKFQIKFSIKFLEIIISFNYILVLFATSFWYMNIKLLN